MTFPCWKRFTSRSSAVAATVTVVFGIGLLRALASAVFRALILENLVPCPYKVLQALHLLASWCMMLLDCTYSAMQSWVHWGCDIEIEVSTRKWATMTLVDILVLPGQWPSDDKLNTKWKSKDGKCLSRLITRAFWVRMLRWSLRYPDFLVFIASFCGSLPCKPRKDFFFCAIFPREVYRCLFHQWRWVFQIKCLVPSTNRALESFSSQTCTQLNVFVENFCAVSVGITDAWQMLCTSSFSLTILLSVT